MVKTIQPGETVRLKGLTAGYLNGATGEVTGPADRVTGRYPVMLDTLLVAERHPNGVKVKPQNLEVVVPTAKDAGAGFPGLSEPDAAAWARGLRSAKRHEWLVDVYRMRVDDDYALGGCNFHGLYLPEHTPDTILVDFLVFCKLAKRTGTVPRPWNWGVFLDKAAGLLGFAFEKDDAKEKYGGENVFSAMMGGRSLRYTGEAVYGTSAMAGGKKSAQHRAVVKEIGKLPAERLLSGAPGVFAEVGGVEAWQRLRTALQSVQ